MTKEEYLDSIYPPKMNAHYKYMHTNPDEFLSSDDEKSQSTNDEATVENVTPPAGDEYNEEKVNNLYPCAKEPDSGGSLDEETVNYSDKNDDKKSADNSLDDDRKPAAK